MLKTGNNLDTCGRLAAEPLIRPAPLGGGVLPCVRGIRVGYPRPMGVLNKRNAVLGWAVWNASKIAAKRKAKAAAPGRADGSMRPNKGAIAAVLATIGGAVWFWRRRSGEPDES
jgi:hypothetical protein